MLALNKILCSIPCMLFLLTIAMGSQVGWAKTTQPGPPPGEIQKSSGGWIFFWEGDRQLFWPPSGPVQLKDRKSPKGFSVDLTRAGIQLGGEKAMGLEVEEVDLGGSRGGKKYLSGKKQPKGRSLNPNAIGKEAAQASKVSTHTVQGVKITQIQYPNDAKGIEMDWGQTRESFYFDRRGTLVRVEQERKVGPFTYTLKQFSDGSFTRTYQKADGQVYFTYDANDQSYRISFINGKGEMLQELECRESCQSV